MAISFGDRVRVLASPDTVERKLVGLVGEVMGETTPSVTDVDVIGQTAVDYALNVGFEGDNGTYWFAEELLEMVDHSPGMEIAVGDKRWVRLANGDWQEVKTSSGFSIWNLFRRKS